MVKSSLATLEVLADKTNYSSGRNGNTVKKITIHHMAGVLTAQRCGELFQASSRNASSNYGIGKDGEIAIYVSEEDRAWTSSNGDNDRQAITFEVANSVASGDYPVSDVVYESMINLCVDICKRYNFRLTWTGDSSGTLTVHRMFAATACPGNYLYGKMAEIAKEVNARLDGTSTSTSTTTTTTSTKKSNDEIATEVIAGKWGSGTERKTKLTAAGYNYNTIQALVNKLI